MYKNQKCDTKQRSYPATDPQRELTGFLELLKWGIHVGAQLD